MTTAATETKAAQALRLRVLVVEDDPGVSDVMCEVVERAFGASALRAVTLQKARQLLKSEKVDLLITDVNLPDGNGTALLQDLREARPFAQAIVVTGEPSVNGAVGALRAGAADFLPKPFSADHFKQCVDRAVERHQAARRQDRRVAALRHTVKKLNAARKTVSKKVDLLCNDLINAYSELSRQVDTVRLQEGYRQCIEQTTDLEQLLCHTMDWLLRQMGYANAGIWLAADDEQFNLGAYMKYTLAGESGVTDALARNLLRMVVRKGFVQIQGESNRSLLTKPELKFLETQDVLAINTTYLGDTLGAIVLFRDSKTPFSPDDVSALKTISPLFAIALAKAVKAGSGEEEEEDAPGDAPEKRPPKKKKDDPADWWKRGGEPPF